MSEVLTSPGAIARPRQIALWLLLYSWRDRPCEMGARMAATRPSRPFSAPLVNPESRRLRGTLVAPVRAHHGRLNWRNRTSASTRKSTLSTAWALLDTGRPFSSWQAIRAQLVADSLLRRSAGQITAKIVASFGACSKGQQYVARYPPH